MHVTVRFYYRLQGFCAFMLMYFRVELYDGKSFLLKISLILICLKKALKSRGLAYCVPLGSALKVL